MERKIGERFDFKGEILEVVEQRGCGGCYFNHRDCSLIRKTGGACRVRTDEKEVIFKRVIFKRVDKSLELLTKAQAEFIQCGIESEIVQEIEEYLKTKQNEKSI